MENKEIKDKIKQVEYYLSKIFNVSKEDVSINCMVSNNIIIDTLEFNINNVSFILSKAN